MSDLKGRLASAVASAFAAEGLAEDLASVTVSDRPDLADFQSNGALAAAKAAKANPREIAGRIAARLADDPRLERVEVAGPGFINLRVTQGLLSERAGRHAGCWSTTPAPTSPSPCMWGICGPLSSASR